MSHTIRFDDETHSHFVRLTARQRSAVLAAIDEQLSHEPALETRNRKPMQADKPGFIAPWELRVAGNLREYYDVQDGPAPIVLVIAIGVKTRSRVRIGDREVEAP